MANTPMMLSEAIQALYPPRPTASRRRVRRSGSSFSTSSCGSQNQQQYTVTNEAPQNVSLIAKVTGSVNSYSITSKKGGLKSRFSELLLEYGEKHLQDWAVCASSSLMNQSSGSGNSCKMEQMEGRLRLCSHSIVFEPRDFSRGIVRIPFRFMMVCPYLGVDDDRLMNSSISNGGGIVIVRSDRHILMKANNIIGPYEHIQAPVEFRYNFLHSPPTNMVSMATLIYEAENKASSTSSSVSFAPNVNINDMPLDKMGNNASKSSSQQQNQIHIDNILFPVVDRPFDATNFLHVQERPVTSNLRCSLHSPLLSQKGCAIVTNFAFYFQPIRSETTSKSFDFGAVSNSGNIGSSSGKALIWPMEDMRAVARRYEGMKDFGMEIYFAKQEGGNSADVSSSLRGSLFEPKSSYFSVLVSFESVEVRERVFRLISQKRSMFLSAHSIQQPPLPLPCNTDRSFLESALELWQAGQLDNFEYLLVLNSAAGRSFHDLSRYPVFPWVLCSFGEERVGENMDGSLDLEDASNYRDLSKPIGALNEERFQDFRKRFDSMVQQQKQQLSQHSLQDEPFMYGTHYSAPGYVLFYLLRVMPEHMLCLQNGKFDVADRLFHSIDDCYKSVLTNPADVKELVPEFFDPDCFDFLINSMGLQLGNLQTGERVNDVILPPWATTAKDFLRQNRAALESDYCTKHLPQWIDLIFGVYSRGVRAKEKRNLFHPTSYIGPADLSAMRSEEDKHRVELQAAEFGIVPDQLFCKEHPGKSDFWEEVVLPDRLRESYGLESK